MDRTSFAPRMRQVKGWAFFGPRMVRLEWVHPSVLGWVTGLQCNAPFSPRMGRLERRMSCHGVFCTPFATEEGPFGAETFCYVKQSIYYVSYAQRKNYQVPMALFAAPRFVSVQACVLTVCMSVLACVVYV